MHEVITEWDRLLFTNLTSLPPPLCSQNETVNQIENLNVKTSRPDDHIIVRPATNTQLRSSEITFPDGHQAFEIADGWSSFTSFFIDYSVDYTRHQVFYPANVLQFPIGTKIYSVSLQVDVNDPASSCGSMRISLGETTEENIPEDTYLESLEIYYEGSDLMNIDVVSQSQVITYSFKEPYTYNGGCLIVDFSLTTQDKGASSWIYVAQNELDGIYNLRSEWNEDEAPHPYQYDQKPDIALEVEFPNNNPIPYIPFQDREQILGYASVGASSTTSYVTIENKGGSAFTVSGLEGSSHFRLSNNNITIPAGSSEQVGLVFTPQSEGTWEENVSLVTSAGNLGLTLTGTTYRQAPYEREVESSDNLRNQLYQDRETITELSVSGEVGESDRYFFTEMPNFKGYIHDVGGPTANFRLPSCKKQEKNGMCTGKKCLAPVPCKALQVDHTAYLHILRQLRALPKVKKVFIRSGIRFDYVMADKDDTFFKELVAEHVSGQLKVAPEHVSDAVLDKMGKPHIACYEAFQKRFYEITKSMGKKQYLVPYLMSSHPGSTLQDAIQLSLFLRDHGMHPEQVQDFYPTPGTISTCMYYTELDPYTMEPVYVPKSPKDKAMQRALLQYYLPQNRQIVLSALRQAGRQDLIGTKPNCLVAPNNLRKEKTKQNYQNKSLKGGNFSRNRNTSSKKSHRS